MYFSKPNSVFARTLQCLALTMLIITSAFANSYYTNVCYNHGSTEKIFYSEGVSMVGAATDSSFPSYSGSFLTGYSGTVWSATGDSEGPIDGVAGRASMGTLATVTRPLVLIDYGLNIPCNAIITDVNFNITRRNADLDDIQDLEIRLRMPDYSLSATNLANGNNWLESTTNWETVSYNDATWGETLTADILNDPRFGIWIIVNKSENVNGARAEIDAVEIEVCYNINGTAFQAIEMAVVKGNSTCGELNGQINISAQNGSGTYEYSIDNGGSWTTNPTFDNLAPGSYLVTVRNTDGTCQTASFNCLVGVDNTILQPGDAVVTCDPFGSPVTLVIERVQPLHTYYTSGYQGSDVSSLIEPAPYAYTTTDLGGEVFSTTIDNDLNIYTGTSSLYSPTTNSPTVISVIDGVTGVASVVGTLPGDKGIAGIEYDTDCEQLFAANLEDGIIYRVDPSTGATLSTFDPLSPDSGAVGYEPLGERILGLAYNPVERRLYYSVWANDQIDNGERNTIRSIAIDATTCDFLPATDVEEFQIPFLSEACGSASDTYSMPVSDIEFNSTGTTMLIAESGVNSSNFLKIAHKARILEYDGSTGAWVIDNAPFPGNPNGCKYGIGTYNEENNSRGGVDFANAGFDGAGCLQGVDDFFVTTVDGAFGVNCVESCVYGFQYTSTGGGGPFQSVGMDIDRDNNSQLKSVYGDVDMVPGCLQSDPIACLEYDLALSIALTTPGPYNPGDIVTYQITVVNEGDIAAIGVDITSNAQTGLLYQGSTIDANVTDNGDETFQIASLPVGGTQVIEMMYQIDPNFTGSTLDVIALITGDDGNDIDSDPMTDQTVDEDGDGDPYDDDEDIVSLPVTILDYDLALTKTLTSAAPYNPGNNVTFQIVVTNEGDITANNVVITDNSPAELLYQSMLPNANVMDNGNETFTIASLAPLASQTIEVTYQIDANFTGASLTNVALITTDDGNDIDSDPSSDETVDEDGDGNPFDDDEDSAIVPTTILDYDLALTKTLTTAGPHNPGDNVTFQIVVTNEGDIAANNVIVTDNSPTNLVYQSMLPDANVTDNGNETFTIASLAPLASQTIELTYQIDANFTGASLTNVALITTDDGNDIDSDPASDETIDEDGDGNPFDDDEDSATVPTTILTYDLALTKTVVTAAPYIPGNNVTYQILVTNQGELIANNVVVTDNSPAGLIYQGMIPDVNVTDNGNETFTIASLAPLASQTIELTYQIDANFTGASLSNIALITTDDGNDIDSDPSSDETIDEDGDGDPFDDDEDSITIPTTILNYDLSLTKSLNTVLPINPGNTVSFLITVANEGDISATNIVVTENSPIDLIYQSMTSDLNVVDNGNETFTILNLAANASQTIELFYQVSPSFTGTSLNNIALITTDDGNDIDSDPMTDQTVDEDGDGDPFDDDEDEANVPISLLDYDLSLNKTLTTTGQIFPGDNVSFNITVTNEGELTANNIIVTDNSPADLIFQSMTADANLIDNGNETFSVLSLPPNSSQVIEVNYQVNSSYTGASLTNIALITSDDGNDLDSDPASDETVDEDGDGDPFDDDEDDEQVIITPLNYDLSLTKELTGSGTAMPGSVVSFRLTVYNEGDITASNIVITENPPAELTYVGSNTNPNVTDNMDGTFTIGGIPAGLSQSFEVNYMIDPTFTGSTLTNVALITADDGSDSDSNPDEDETIDEDGDGDPVDDDEDVLDFNVSPIPMPGLIGDFVWEDINGDGIQDVGEPGIANSEVVLHTPDGVIVDIEYTDASGYYQFDNVTPGQYYIEFIAPDGMEVTFPNTNNNDTTDSDVDNSNGFNTTPLFTLGNSEQDLTWDAGFYKCIPVGDLVWFDNNENDIWDTVENGVNGLRVNIYKRQNDGEYILWDYTFTGPNTSTPSDDGYFKFCVAPGEYYLEFIDPPFGLVSAQANVGSDDEIDSDVTGANGAGTTASMVLTSGQEVCNIGAGYYAMGTIGDFVFMDSNNNGLRDPEESGIGNVYVEAYNVEGEVVGSASTNSDGQYQIDYLQQEDVYLKFYTNSNYASTTPHNGDDSLDSDIDHSNGPMTTPYFNINSGEHLAGVDAGFVLGTVAAEWLSFTGEHLNAYNQLRWAVGSQINTSHFEIERSISSTQEFEIIETLNTDQNSIYEFNDFDLNKVGLYYYRIKLVDNNGDYNYTNTISIDVKSLGRVNQVQIFPNPMVNEFSLEVTLTEDQSSVAYDLYSASGKLVRASQVLSENVSAGIHNFTVNVSNLERGIYTLHLTSGNYSSYKKIIIVR